MKSLDHDFHEFITVITDKLDKYVPTKEVVINDKQYIHEPWITKRLQKCQKKQLKLYEKSLKSGNKELVTKYKNYSLFTKNQKEL